MAKEVIYKKVHVDMNILMTIFRIIGQVHRTIYRFDCIVLRTRGQYEYIMNV